MEWRCTTNGRTYQLTNESYLIGRGNHCDIIFDDVSVSLEHARLFKNGYKWELQDLDSTNGIYVDGNLASSFVISSSIEIKIGANTIVIESPYGLKQISPGTKSFALGAVAAITLLSGVHFIIESKSTRQQYGTPYTNTQTRSAKSLNEETFSDTASTSGFVTAQETQSSVPPKTIVEDMLPQPEDKRSIENTEGDLNAKIVASANAAHEAKKKQAKDAAEAFRNRSRFTDIYRLKEQLDLAIRALPDGSTTDDAKAFAIDELLTRVNENRKFRRWYENPTLLDWSRELAERLIPSTQQKVLLATLHEAILFESRDMPLTAQNLLSRYVMRDSPTATLYAWVLGRKNGIPHQVDLASYYRKNSHLISGLSHRVGYFADFALFRFYESGLMGKDLQWVVRPDLEKAKWAYQNMIRNNHWLGQLTRLEFCHKGYRFMECPDDDKAIEIWEQIAIKAKHPEAQYIYATSYWENTTLNQIDSRYFKHLELADFYGSFDAHKRIAENERRKPTFEWGLKKIGAYKIVPNNRQSCNSEFGKHFKQLNWSSLVFLSPKQRLNLELLYRDANAVGSRARPAVSYRNRAFLRSGKFAYTAVYERQGNSISDKTPIDTQYEKRFIDQRLMLFESFDLKPNSVFCISN